MRVALAGVIVRFALVAGLVAFPFHARALSCMAWHVEDAYRAADESPDPYIAVQGKLTFDAEELPQVNWDRQEDVPPKTIIDARLTGKAWTGHGFDQPFDRDVTLIVECHGPWCAQVTDGADTLAFLERTEAGFTLRTNPCGWMVFQKPSDDTVSRATSCLQGKSCSPP